MYAQEIGSESENLTRETSHLTECRTKVWNVYVTDDVTARELPVRDAVREQMLAWSNSSRCMETTDITVNGVEAIDEVFDGQGTACGSWNYYEAGAIAAFPESNVRSGYASCGYQFLLAGSPKYYSQYNECQYVVRFYGHYSPKVTVSEDDLNEDDSVQILTVSDEDRREAERLREEAEKKQREEEAMAVQKAAEKLNSDFVADITKAVQGADGNTAVIRTNYFTCFTQEMMETIMAHPEVGYEIHYCYQGKRYVLTIPVGADFSSLESSNGYYGFRYLDSIFGGYEE